MSGAVFPPCSLVWGQTMVGVLVVMATSFKRTYASTLRLSELLKSVPQPRIRPQLTTPPQETLGHSQASLAQSLVGSLLLSLGSWCAKGLFVPSKSLFPQHSGTSVIKSLWPSMPNSLGVPSGLPDPQVEKSVVGPRTSAPVWELLWYNCSPVCGSSAQWFYDGAKGDLLQEDLCDMPRLPGLLQSEPLSPWQATADPCLHRRHSNTQRLVWLSLLWGSLLLSLGSGVHEVSFVPSEHLWRVWDLILNMIVPLLLSCWGFSFALKGQKVDGPTFGNPCPFLKIVWKMAPTH